MAVKVKAWTERIPLRADLRGEGYSAYARFGDKVRVVVYLHEDEVWSGFREVELERKEIRLLAVDVAHAHRQNRLSSVVSLEMLISSLEVE